MVPKIQYPTPVADKNNVDLPNINERRSAEESVGLLPNEIIRPPLNPKKWCRIGCVNVNKIHRTGRKAIVVEEIRRFRLEIAGFCEIR